MTDMMTDLPWIVAAYLVGGIPFGYLILSLIHI